MTPIHKRFFPRGEAQRMLPGLEYARSLIETAMLICQHVKEEPDAPPSDRRNGESPRVRPDG